MRFAAKSFLFCTLAVNVVFMLAAIKTGALDGYALGGLAVMVWNIVALVPKQPAHATIKTEPRI